jgi:uncharacterized Zn finger protein
VAKVSGSEIYTVVLKIVPVDKVRWRSICTDCSGSIDSLVELLQGRLSKGVMERICRQETGLFPSPKEINLSCSCPDWADMCKHAAAVLYGVGVRLDRQPELLFRLHGVDEKELITNATGKPPLSKQKPAQGKVLGSGEDLSALFGLELAQSAPAKSESKSKPRGTAAKTTKKSPAKKGAKKG